MAALTGQTIASSYEQLLHCDADGGLTTSLQAIKDGDNGITSALKLARDKVEVLPSGADSATAFEVSQNDGTAILTVNSSSPTVTITGDGVVTDDLTLNSDASVLTFGAGSDVTFTHDNGTGMNVASAGDFDIAVSAGNGTFTVADGQTLTLGQSGASAILLSPHGTAGSELASLINTAGTTDGSDAAGSILLSAVAGGMSFAWNDAKDLWAEGGRAVVTANEDAADCIKLHADDGTSQTITVVNDAGTSVTEGSAAVQLLSTAGGVGVRSAANLAKAVNITSDGGTTGSIAIFNDQGTSVTEGAESISILSDAGGVGLRSTANLANAINLTVDGGTTSTMTLFNDQGTSVTEGAESIALLSDAGGVGIRSTADLANAVNITVDGGTSSTMTLFNDQGTSATEGAASIQLLSDVGGINVKSGLDGANAILLTADGGTSETIKLHADQGTGAASLNLLSDAGGITLSAGNTSHGVIVGDISGAPVTIGHTTSETTVNDNLTVAGDLVVTGSGAGISHDGSTADGVLTYKDADEATVESNLTYDGTILKLAYGCSFLVGGNVADNTTPETGLCWEAGGNRTSYGIYRTDGAWSSPDYQQLMLKWTTGIIIDGGDAYGKSGLDIQCAVSKSSGSFKIDHPLPSMKDTHHLVHSFTESPRADLIYRDKVTLVDGSAIINIDTVAGMTEGTFVLLCDSVQCFTSNESDWSAVKGSVSGNILTIECEDSSSTADVAWMVIGDRQDEHIMDTNWTDENGKPIIEPEKPIIETEEEALENA